MSPVIRRLDFSEWHPMGHIPFSHTCRSYYGGGRRHLWLWWTWRGRLTMRRLTLCKLGRHEWGEWLLYDDVSLGEACGCCYKERA